MTKAERTRQYIIDKASPLINKKGMAGTSINDIMEVTQLAKGGIYGNFENKEEICREVLKNLLEKLSTAIDTHLAGKNSAKEKLFGLFDFYKSLIGREDYYGCPMLNFGAEADDTNPEIKQLVNKSITATQNRYIRLIKQGIAAGEFHSSFDPEIFAIKAFAMIEGALWASRLQNNARQIRLITDILKKEVDENTL